MNINIPSLESFLPPPIRIGLNKVYSSVHYETAFRLLSAYIDNNPNIVMPVVEMAYKQYVMGPGATAQKQRYALDIMTALTFGDRFNDFGDYALQQVPALIKYDLAQKNKIFTKQVFNPPGFVTPKSVEEYANDIVAELKRNVYSSNKFGAGVGFVPDYINQAVIDGAEPIDFGIFADADIEIAVIAGLKEAGFTDGQIQDIKDGKMTITDPDTGEIYDWAEIIAYTEDSYIKSGQKLLGDIIYASGQARVAAHKQELKEAKAQRKKFYATLIAFTAIAITLAIVGPMISSAPSVVSTAPTTTATEFASAGASVGTSSSVLATAGETVGITGGLGTTLTGAVGAALTSPEIQDKLKSAFTDTTSRKEEEPAASPVEITQPVTEPSMPIGLIIGAGIFAVLGIGYALTRR